MSGAVKYVRGLENRSGRMKFKPGPKVYWRTIIGTLALGYQRRHAGSAGRWIARSYVGDEKYRQTPIAMADDYEPSNGTLGPYLCRSCRACSAELPHRPGPASKHPDRC